MKSPKAILFMIILLLSFPVFAESGVWCGAEANGTGMIADISGNVCAQVEIGARMEVGAIMEREYGFYGVGGASLRLFAKQYSRFVEVPSYVQFSLGGGGFYLFENLALAADLSLVAAKIGEDWEIGGEIRVCPRFEFAELDVIRYSVGIPVSFMYSGNTIRGGLGVAVRMEVY